MDPKLQEEYSEVCSNLSVWRALVESVGWARLRAVAEGQVNERSKEVLRKPLASMDRVLEQEFMKGELSGIELFIQLPEIQIEVLKESQAKLEKEMDDVPEESSLVDSIDARSGGIDELGRELDIIDEGRDSFGSY